MKRLIAGLSLVCSLLLSVNMFAACGGDGSSQSGGGQRGDYSSVLERFYGFGRRFDG